jgi:hypothetical protein
VIGWILQHIVAILLGLLMLATAIGLVWWVGSLAVDVLERAAERAAGPVCQH